MARVELQRVETVEITPVGDRGNELALGKANRHHLIQGLDSPVSRYHLGRRREIIKAGLHGGDVRVLPDTELAQEAGRLCPLGEIVGILAGGQLGGREGEPEILLVAFMLLRTLGRDRASAVGAGFVLDDA